jgi:hypothetical protein
MLLHTSPLLRLLLDSEDGSDVLLRNIGKLQTIYKAYYPRMKNSSILKDLFVTTVYCLYYQYIWFDVLKYSALRFGSWLCSRPHINNCLSLVR